MKQELLYSTLGLRGLLVVCAIINAALRKGVLIPSLGETVVRALSPVMLSAVTLVVAY